MDPFFIGAATLAVAMLVYICIRIAKNRRDERLAREEAEDFHRAPKFPPPLSRMPIPPAGPRSAPNTSAPEDHKIGR